MLVTTQIQQNKTNGNNNFFCQTPSLSFLSPNSHNLSFSSLPPVPSPASTTTRYFLLLPHENPSQTNPTPNLFNLFCEYRAENDDKERKPNPLGKLHRNGYPNNHNLSSPPPVLHRRPPPPFDLPQPFDLRLATWQHQKQPNCEADHSEEDLYVLADKSPRLVLVQLTQGIWIALLVVILGSILAEQAEQVGGWGCLRWVFMGKEEKISCGGGG